MTTAAADAGPAPAVTQLLASFVAETPASTIPAGARTRALVTMADTLGTTAAGLREDAVTTLQAGLLPWAGPGPSRLAGSDLRADPPTAALVNAAAAHALDYDAVSFAVSGFVGSAAISALAALVDAGAEATGADVVTAYCLGWEAAAAIGRGVNPHHYAKGWHPTSTLGRFAATAASCRLLRLSAEQTAMALSIAVAEASGVKTMIGNMLNPYHVGTAARNGLVAARLASVGFVGNAAALEADQGFLNLFNGRGEHSPERIVGDLGARWDLADPGPVLKVYPCCGLVHSTLDALLALRREHGLTADDVDEVVVRVHAYVPRVMHVDVPDSGYAAKFSIPYCCASAMIDGACGLPSFDTVRPEVVEWGKRVSVSVPDELRDGSSFFGEEYSEVDVTVSGERLTKRVRRMENRGTGANLVDADIQAKLQDCFRHGGAPGDPLAAWRAITAADGPDRFAFWELMGVVDG